MNISFPMHTADVLELEKHPKFRYVRHLNRKGEDFIGCQCGGYTFAVVLKEHTDYGVLRCSSCRNEIKSIAVVERLPDFEEDIPDGSGGKDGPLIA